MMAVPWLETSNNPQEAPLELWSQKKLHMPDVVQLKFVWPLCLRPLWLGGPTWRH
jgi:hypothetical protein